MNAPEHNGPTLIVPNSGKVHKKRYEQALSITGYMQPKQLEWLSMVAQQCKVIVEVGSWKGRSTTMISGFTRKVFCVDTWKGSEQQATSTKVDLTHTEVQEKGSETIFNEFKHNLKEDIDSGSVVIIRESSLTAFNTLKEMGIMADMVFIDGSHFSPIVDQDIQNYRQFVRSGGIFCGHDSTWADVRRALNKYVPGWKRGPGSIWWTMV